MANHTDCESLRNELYRQEGEQSRLYAVLPHIRVRATQQQAKINDLKNQISSARIGGLSPLTMPGGPFGAALSVVIAVRIKIETDRVIARLERELAVEKQKLSALVEEVAVLEQLQRTYNYGIPMLKEELRQGDCRER